ncbi:MAG: hypothetical protein II501_03320, partial [Clostridia bacterium]|nr:hypothetical protein [Clostridia bacterium]
ARISMLSIQALISAERKNKIQKSKKSSGAFLLYLLMIFCHIILYHNTISNRLLRLKIFK